MIRLFVGLEFPEDIRENLYSLRGGLPCTRWIDKENYHLTLRFIGNVTEREAEDIHSALQFIRFKAFDLQLTQLGMFKKGPNPRHLWVGVNNYHVLDALNDRIESVLTRLGVPPDTRKFHAHTTIAKFDPGATLEKVQTFITYNNLFKTAFFRAYYFTLFSSHSAEIGSTFRVEHQYPLDLTP